MTRTTSDEGSEQLINNRQNGRRRGRGTGAPRPNGGGAPDRGNRLDNRARGNANQLHDKYKTLARDAQMQGDRVLTEYYLQFADHYFRILSETRSRFEEQRPQRNDRFDGNDFDDDGDEGAGDDRVEGGRFDRQERAERYERPERGERQERPDRGDRDRGGDRDGGEPRRERVVRPDGEMRPERGERRDEPRQRHEAMAGDEGEAAREERPRRGRRPRNPADDNGGAEIGGERIEHDRLPPSFSAATPVSAPAGGDDAAEGEKPRRRLRRPRAEDAAVEL